MSGRLEHVDLVVETPLPALPVSAQTARQTVCTALAGWPEDSVGTAELLASELVTNALRHAGPPLALRVLREPDLARLEVDDASETTPELLAQTTEPLALTGRGLTLIAALADAWGVDSVPGHGKTVWCVIYL